MKKFPVYKILTPLQFSGSVHGDWGFSIDGVLSKNSYVSRRGAHNAMWRALDKFVTK